MIILILFFMVVGCITLIFGSFLAMAIIANKIKKKRELEDITDQLNGLHKVKSHK